MEYIKSTFDIIISIKVDSKINEYKKSLHQDNNAATEYEVLLQKLEASIRQHISYEHQFKIEYEKLLNKAEEIDLENKVLADHFEKQDDKLKKIINQNNEYKSKIKKLEKENEALKNKEKNLKEQIDLKEKELIQSQIKLKELKAIKNIKNKKIFSKYKTIYND